jgi:pimeloyl-ACP methyl ester carboxylesterase
VNPGGPGASGVDFVRSLGHSIRNLTGDDRDIVGFDPRGVGYTKPTADCYTFSSSGDMFRPSDADILRGQFNRLEFSIAGEALGFVNLSAGSLRQIDEAQRAKAKLCGMKDQAQGNGSILRCLDTQNVARDLLKIVDAWDSWRDGLLVERGNNHEIENSTNDCKGQLDYLGFSYGQFDCIVQLKLADISTGTYLGATFAAMFPDRVGRMVLDGVMDAVTARDPIFPGNIRDADTVHDLFFNYCAEAGPSRCEFAREGDDAQKLRDRAYSIRERLHEHSLVGVQPRAHTPMIFTRSILQSASFGVLFNPVLLFPILATIYDLLYREGYEELFASLSQVRDRMKPCTHCSKERISSFDSGDASTAIRCADAEFVDASVPELDAIYRNLSQISSFADVYMGLGLQCNTWPIRPTIPPLPLFDNASINTSFPLLFVSNTHDPITPLRNGIAMANLFRNSRLLEQKGEGHCSTAEVSLCTVSKIRAYLQDGKVPSTPRRDAKQIVDGAWEKCEVDERPWDSFRGAVAIGQLGYSKQDVEIVEAWKEVQMYLASEYDGEYLGAQSGGGPGWAA